MTIQKFYKDSFPLVIDLKSIDDRNKVGSGRKVVNTQSGVCG